MNRKPLCNTLYDIVGIIIQRSTKHKIVTQFTLYYSKLFYSYFLLQFFFWIIFSFVTNGNKYKGVYG